MFKDLTGQRFGRLVVVKRIENDKHGSAQWLCQCDCGNSAIVKTNLLNRGNTKSCGCLQKERTRESDIKIHTTHGQTGTRLFKIWCGMKRRCYCNRATGYENYGGRGIKMCEEWKEDFQPFYDWSITNGYADEKSIDRIDVNGDYCPDNCRWTDTTTQANNTRRNHYIKYKGKVKTIAEWAKETGINQVTISSRLRNGWTIEETLETPTAEDRGKGRGNHRIIEYKGEAKTMKQWAKEKGLTRQIIRNRLNKKGWSIEKTLETPRERRKK